MTPVMNMGDCVDYLFVSPSLLMSRGIIFKRLISITSSVYSTLPSHVSSYILLYTHNPLNYPLSSRSIVVYF